MTGSTKQHTVGKKREKKKSCKRLCYVESHQEVGGKKIVKRYDMVRLNFFRTDQEEEGGRQKEIQILAEKGLRPERREVLREKPKKVANTKEAYYTKRSKGRGGTGRKARRSILQKRREEPQNSGGPQYHSNHLTLEK